MRPTVTAALTAARAAVIAGAALCTACTHFIGASDAPPPQLRADAPAPVPSSLPKVIDIATPTQATNTFYDYAIADGLLYQRKNAQESWALIDGLGLPNVDGKPMKELTGKLTRVYADGNIVAVVDEGMQVFRFDTNLATFNFEPTLYGWRTDWGGGLLKIRKDLRSLSYGRRTVQNVGTIEDRFGYKSLAANPASLLSVFHENGYSGLMHFYGISEDGHRLFFADNGLTNVFNYEFDVPRVDDFEGVSVASSASMVVLLDTKGRLWAKFLDFDWYGSNPMMFEYSYVDTNAGKTAPEPEGFGVVHIPLPTWKELPAPSLPDGAWLSTQMGMRVTGSANFARELRIRGKDGAGACGLWITELDKPAGGWRFEDTGICAADADRFTAVADATKAPRGKTLTGELVVDGARYDATVTGYTLVDSPASLELRDHASRALVWKGALHLVPGWSPSLVVDPGRDGRYKLFYGTVESDAAYAETPFSRAHNLKTFDFAAYGAENELLLKPLRDDRASGTLTAATATNDVVAAYLARAATNEGVAVACRDLKTRVGADVQQLTTLVLATPALNAFGLVTGTRFWYYHGISMIPPLGRMMDWGTRLFYDRWQLARHEQQLVRDHCHVE